MVIKEDTRANNFCIFCFFNKGGTKIMQKEIIIELEDLRDETEFILNNKEIVEV